MTNPLAKYFRQPGIHISLPSKGLYCDGIELEMSGEVGILPMTAKDEIIVNNPDSLLNGSALEQIVHSCCPAIKDVRKLPIVDIDVIVMSAKLVTYGDRFKLQAPCPKCKKGVEFSLSIRNLLGKVKSLPDECAIRLNDDVIIYLRPHTLETANKIGMAEFEENSLLKNIISNTDIENFKKVEAISDSIKKITQLHMDSLADCVRWVQTPEGRVDDTIMIQEFLQNSDRNVIENIKDALKELNSCGMPRTTFIVCDNPECQHKWELPIVYDPTSFFAKDS
jgi:hypothetical protein